MNILVFISIYMFVFVVIVFKDITPENHYLRAIEDKTRLVQTIKGQKILLIGDSNLPFGIDSKLIEDSTGYNVVNTGLFAGMGLQFYLNQFKENIKANDLVIISVGYNQFTDRFYGSKKLAFVLKTYPHYLKYISDYAQIKNILKGFLNIPLSYIKKTTFKFEPGAGKYSSDNFNHYGDYIDNLSQNSTFKGTTKSIKLEINKKAIPAINSFSQYIESKGAKCYFSFSPLPKSLYQINRTEFDMYEKQIQAQLSVPILGELHNYVFEDSLFYDSKLHLNNIGKNKRTVIFIKKLKEHI